MPSFSERFSAYFDREVAQKAAKSLTSAAEIEFLIVEPGGTVPVEEFNFTKLNNRNRVTAGSSADPQVTFKLTTGAAEAILADASDDIGQIGVNIAKLVMGGDAHHRIQVKIHSGFLGLFSKGYFGVITAGGGAFASFLASRGLGGIGAIKSALKKTKQD